MNTVAKKIGWFVIGCVLCEIVEYTFDKGIDAVKKCREKKNVVNE